jgi:DNA-binding NtrC family response regulator
MPNLESLQAELNKIERRRAKLEQQIKSQAEALYTALPRKVGLRSVDELVVALAPYASTAVRQKLQGAAPAKPSAAKPAVQKAAPKKGAPSRGPRARHSEEEKAAVRRAIQEGKLTMSQIATKHGIPLDTLKKWKRNWGMTAHAQARKAASRK